MSNLQPGTTQEDIDRAIEDAEPPEFEEREYPTDEALDALARRFEELAADLTAFRNLPASKGEECPF